MRTQGGRLCSLGRSVDNPQTRADCLVKEFDVEVVGAEYVGLFTGACAHLGHRRFLAGRRQRNRAGRRRRGDHPVQVKDVSKAEKQAGKAGFGLSKVSAKL